MERNYLICVLVGVITAEKKYDITGEDLRILIDERLQLACLSLLGTEPSDNQLLAEISGELQIYVLGQRTNRKMRRMS